MLLSVEDLQGLELILKVLADEASVASIAEAMNERAEGKLRVDVVESEGTVAASSGGPR